MLHWRPSAEHEEMWDSGKEDRIDIRLVNVGTRVRQT